MTFERIPTRQRIVNTALELFARQGITETTTRQIADRAEVNEVTVFRHFGNKHGLLLAVLQEFLQEYLLLTQLGESLMSLESEREVDLAGFLYHYIYSSLEALENVPELMRSLVGEAGQYPLESRQALAQGITQINKAIATALGEMGNIHLPTDTMSLATMINTCVLGYTIMVLTSDVELIWRTKEDFINTLVKILIATSDPATTATDKITDKHLGENIVKSTSSSKHIDLKDIGKVQEIEATEVRRILLQAKRQGLRDYAIAFILFGAGLSPEELVGLNLADYQATKVVILKIQERLVSLNHKIGEHRYGSSTNNPLSNYLKNRKDKHPKMFVSDTLQPLTTTELEHLWQGWQDRQIPIAQTQHTWRIEMLRRGIDRESFQIISGLTLAEIEVYEFKVKEHLALEQAIALDRAT